MTVYTKEERDLYIKKCRYGTDARTCKSAFIPKGRSLTARNQAVCLRDVKKKCRYGTDPRTCGKRDLGVCLRDQVDCDVIWGDCDVRWEEADGVSAETGTQQ